MSSSEQPPKNEESTKHTEHVVRVYLFIFFIVLFIKQLVISL
jgi:hypothetical protein